MTYYVIMQNDCAIFVAKTEDEARAKITSISLKAEKQIHEFQHAEFYGGGLRLTITNKHNTMYYRAYEVPGE